MKDSRPDPIAFIGGGNMARALIGGLLRAGTPAAALCVADPMPDTDALGLLSDKFGGFTVTHDNAAAARGASVVVLAVKPQAIREACGSIADEIKQTRPLVISVAAGTRIDDIDAWLGGGARIVRCMPNTPALLGVGATGMCANAAVDAAARAQAERILSSVGIVEWIDDETLMDAVTALSGSGPAYFFQLVEHLESAAVALGLPRASARRLAIQTGLGAMTMAAGADAGSAAGAVANPAELRRRVTSPGGTTAAALAAFDQGGFEALVKTALTAARDRGRELGAAASPVDTLLDKLLGKNGPAK